MSARNTIFAGRSQASPRPSVELVEHFRGLSKNWSFSVEPLFRHYQEVQPVTYIHPDRRRLNLTETVNEVVENRLQGLSTPGFVEVGDLRAGQVRNPQMKNWRRIILWDWLGDTVAHSSDPLQPTGDLRIAINIPKGGEVQVEAIARVEGTLHPLIYERNSQGRWVPVKSSRRFKNRLRRCLGCHNAGGKFARSIDLKNYRPSPGWLVDDRNQWKTE